MNQEFIRIRQSDVHEPVATPPPARPRRTARDRGSARPREDSEEPEEVKTPGVMAAEAAQSTGTQEAFFKQQMEFLGAMKDTLLTRLGAPTGRASTINNSAYSGMADAA